MGTVDVEIEIRRRGGRGKPLIHIRSGNSSEGLIEDRQRTRMDIETSTRHVESSQSNDLGDIARGNSWNIEHEVWNYSRNGVQY